MNEKIGIPDEGLSDLMGMFPEAKITIRDRIPTNILLLYTFLNINKTIKDIKYSSAEIGESILALVAMIPDELRDKQFVDEIQAANKEILVDVRPKFCEVKASADYCRRKGIPDFIKVSQLNYFEMYHAVFNLLMRKHMLFKAQQKEIMTGITALNEDEE
ncbi:MAG: hypothetical protein KAW52_05185 [candidate division Zixibacteria bacterium]|nr:hypothetical protein [candidate division Zixibacteria bacterium]